MFKMNGFVLLVLCVIKLAVYAQANDKHVVCYYGTWAAYRNGLGKFDVDNINTDLCTHIVYTFLGINTRGTVVSLDPYLDYPDNWGKDNLRKFVALKDQNPNLKLILAVGGWNEGSAKYSIMAANPKLRKNFITSAIQIIQKYGFDGLDIDWEYPNRGDSVFGQDDINNYTQLLKELREEFDKHGLHLSAAVASVKSMASLSYDIPAISQYLDLINVMTYDMSVASDRVTGHNSPLHKGEKDVVISKENLKTVDGVLEYWLKQGCPPEKLILGLPLYGHTFKLSDPKNNGVGALSAGPGISGPYTATNGFIGYNELCVKLRKETWNIKYDNSSEVPYAVQGKNWISYDDAKSLTAKVKYALQFNIAGIMLWSIETDDFLGICQSDDCPLTRAVNIALGRSIESSSTALGTSTSNPTSSKPSTTDPIQEFICKDIGFYSNPKECSSYYYCVKSAGGNLVPKLLRCPGNLYWDQENQFCNYPDQANCYA
ncbi:probable chitinase 2 isoform X1 [Vanessa atalanta]|uniref:probable chitinase 2 isoform X1 n=1 Tax=Vanessa atalanta TaxID=42275 RepID=UPI001FCD4DC5|nr:probable chitinase 2 isoform X1 [Vanessa atalanta]